MNDGTDSAPIFPVIDEIDVSNTSLADLGEPVPLSEHLLRVAKAPNVDPYPPRKNP